MCGRLLAVLVHVCDVLRQTQVVVHVGFVLDEPQQVEAGQQRRRELDVLLDWFCEGCSGRMPGSPPLGSNSAHSETS